MTTAVSIYKNGLILATGTATAGSATIASVTATSVVGQGRNVQVTATAGNDAGKTVNHRVVTDGLTSLTLNSTFDLA